MTRFSISGLNPIGEFVNDDKTVISSENPARLAVTGDYEEKDGVSAALQPTKTFAATLPSLEPAVLTTLSLRNRTITVERLRDLHS